MGMMKRQYLPKAALSSYVLQYDWSEGGDVEVVVEDIERLQMDYHDKYDKQQKDWRLHTEDGFASKRNLYTNKDKIILTAPEGTEQERIRMALPGNFYKYGFNTILGDPEPMFNFNMKTAVNWYKDAPYFVDNWQSDSQWSRDEDRRKSRKAAGDP